VAAQRTNETHIINHFRELIFALVAHTPTKEKTRLTKEIGQGVSKPV